MWSRQMLWYLNMSNVLNVEADVRVSLGMSFGVVYCTLDIRIKAYGDNKVILGLFLGPV